MLKSYACIPENTNGRQYKESSDIYRTEYQRDRDRILHSASFRRLQYKTQVFVNHEGDHYRTRLTHSLEVAQIARSISRCVGLCEDLSEALSLAHDLGHAPFGHAGEDALNEVMMEFGGFNHNAHTLKLLTVLENRYLKFPGLNLTWETLEGIAKHNGPLVGKNSVYNELEVPQAILDFAEDYKLFPDKFASLEAQVSSLSDDIAYINHDLEDGFRAGLIKIYDIEQIGHIKEISDQIKSRYPKILPRQLIHEILRKTLKLMIEDLIETTNANIEKYKIKTVEDVRELNQPVAKFSPKIQNLSNEIRVLLKVKMYNHFKVNRMTNKAKRIIKELFHIYMNDPGCLPSHWRTRLDDDNQNKNVRARIIADFIAGMTDRYAIREYKSFFDLHQNKE